MASRFPAHWLDELRSRSDIVQIVSSYVGLKKSGRKISSGTEIHRRTL